MSPITHGMLSWLAIQPAGLGLRQRRLLTLVGLAPDLDGLGMVADLLTRGGASPTSWFASYHHVLCHNLLAGVASSTAVWLACGRKGRVLLLGLAVFHLHLLCDLAGSGGPDGSRWDLSYAWPFSSEEWGWPGQWALDAWPNLVISVIALSAILWLGAYRGRTLVEVLSPRADAVLVGVLRRRLRGGGPSAGVASPG